MTNRAPLDSFESALLSELRDVVTERSATQPRRRKPVLVAAAAATTVAASVGALVFGFGTGGPAPASAYSVSAEDDGDIVVQIRRLDDADGLERALAEHGITAEVSYGGGTDDCVQFPVDDDEGPCSVPDGQGPGAGATLDTEPDLSGPVTEATPAPEPDGAGTDPCGFGDTPPSTLRRADDGWTLTIPADSPLHDGVDLHIITQGGADDAGLSTMFTKGDTSCGSHEFVL